MTQLTVEEPTAMTDFQRMLFSFSIVALLLAGCQHSPLPTASTHLTTESRTGETGSAIATNGTSDNSIPAPITNLPALPPTAAAPGDYFTLVVDDVPVDEVIFALARDAGLNVDIRTTVSGSLTMNAIDQPLDLLLDRIAAQAGLRFRQHHNSLIVEADLPYRHTYRIDYINMDRAVSNRIAVSTQIATSGSSDLAAGSSGGNNNSQTELTSQANNNFWDQLVANISAMIADTNSSDENQSNADVIPNRVASLLTVNATEAQHRLVGDYLNDLISSTHRQVLIEATIAEVNLSRDYQAGVDWSVLGNRGWGFVSDNIGTNLSDIPFTALTYTNTTSPLGDINVVIRALQTFGDVKVLSSPKLMALNNQTALLKVVDERVYFTFEVEREEEEDGDEEVTVETTVNTVPVGLVMAVTPYISENSEVTLNVRPTISRIIGFVQFDDPFIRGVDGEPTLISRVPEVQVREIETVLKVNSGQTVMLGGLMQDTIDNRTEGVPLLSRLPYVGDAFSYRNDVSSKTELVIFLRPVVTGNGGMDTPPFDRYRQYLPQTDTALSIN